MVTDLSSDLLNVIVFNVCILTVKREISDGGGKGFVACRQRVMHPTWGHGFTWGEVPPPPALKKPPTSIRTEPVVRHKGKYTTYYCPDDNPLFGLRGWWTKLFEKLFRISSLGVITDHIDILIFNVVNVTNNMKIVSFQVHPLSPAAPPVSQFV